MSLHKILSGLVLWLLLIIVIFGFPFIPFNLDKKMDTPFLSQHGSDNALIFFGFQGCGDVCPTTLITLKQLLNRQKNTSLWPHVIFVDIDVSSNSEDASRFAKQFHTSFTGLHIPAEELKAISTEFGLNIKQEGSQISHFGRTYLLRRNASEWRLVKIYNPDSLSLISLQSELFD